MYLNEPPPTPYDLRFRIGPVPVRVHPLFWLLTLVLGLSLARSDGWLLVIWMFVAFVSILVHELGHIMAMMSFGETGHIVLYGMGGLAIPSGHSAWGRGRSPFQQILISLAGPFAGFLLGFLAIVCFRVGGGHVEFEPGLPLGLNLTAAVPPPGMSPYVAVTCSFFWYVNWFWGLLNLLPIYPLDGGKISRELFQLWEPREGVIRSLWLSVITSGLLAAVAILQWGAMFLGFFFIYFAVTNYQMIAHLSGRGFGGPRW